MEELQNISKISADRFLLWINFINKKQLSNVAEIGVFKGEFAERILQSCGRINKYYMIDPWRNLEDWNKPANIDDNIFDEYYKETLSRTDFAKEKRIILRGKTIDVINEVKDESLDFVYIDGDHTLKGITIDLINTWPKLKENGYLAGDDFCPSIWQHDKNFEPTLVFPFAIYFAEAVNATIYGLPYNQFLIYKDFAGFRFIDLTNECYSNRGLLNQLVVNKVLKKESGVFNNFFKKVKNKLK